MAEFYSNLLLKSAKTGNLERVKEAWMKTENRYETDFLGHNALTLSIIHNHFDVFKFLVDSGANLNRANNVSSTFNGFSGAKRQQCLKEYGDDSFLGATPLICAVRNRDFSMVQYLVDKGVDVNYVDSENHTALYYAALKRCGKEMIEFLIRSGSLIEETRNQLDEYGSYHEDFLPYWEMLKEQLGI